MNLGGSSRLFIRTHDSGKMHFPELRTHESAGSPRLLRSRPCSTEIANASIPFTNLGHASFGFRRVLHLSGQAKVFAQSEKETPNRYRLKQPC